MKTESTLEFTTNIPEKIAYEKLHDSDKDTETFCRNNKISTYNNKSKTVLNLNCGEYINNKERLAGKNRITDESDGTKCYYYRYNSTNLPYAKIALLPQELTFGLLSDFSMWEINDYADYLGRHCIVISGATTDEYGKKINTSEFEMYVDEATGIILKLECFSVDGELSKYIYMKNINIDSDDATLYVNSIDYLFDEDKYTGYVDIVKKVQEARKREAERDSGAEQ